MSEQGHYCKSGRHYWTKPENAARCCNGYNRILREDGYGRYWYEWEPILYQEAEGER